MEEVHSSHLDRMKRKLDEEDRWYERYGDPRRPDLGLHRPIPDCLSWILDDDPPSPPYFKRKMKEPELSMNEKAHRSSGRHVVEVQVHRSAELEDLIDSSQQTEEAQHGKPEDCQRTIVSWMKSDVRRKNISLVQFCDPFSLLRYASCELIFQLCNLQSIPYQCPPMGTTLCFLLGYGQSFNAVMTIVLLTKLS